jgi:hypothetical protein
MTPVIAWLVRNTLRNVGVARPFKLEVLLLLPLNATCYAPATVHSIAVARIASIFTTTPALPRLHLPRPPPLPVQMLFTRPPTCLEIGRTTDAGCKS